MKLEGRWEFEEDFGVVLDLELELYPCPDLDLVGLRDLGGFEERRVSWMLGGMCSVVLEWMYGVGSGLRGLGC